MVLATRQSIELAEVAETLNARFAGKSAGQILSDILHGGVAGRPAVLSSFGAEAVVLLKLVADRKPSTPVVFLETRKHFPETLEYVDQVMDSLGMTTLVRVRPDPNQLLAADPDGTLHITDSDQCCYIRKTLPMIGVLKDYDCVLTGRKRFQTDDRQAMQTVEVQNNWLRINPLAEWSQQEIDAFLDDQQLMQHPLVAMGFPSIGCAPCTVPSDNARDGRWAGIDKTECGIHQFGNEDDRASTDGND
ncbi:phosphoadenylyl-sulfate reductase [Parasphingopyxis sp. CP4]|uniref:phosphoadenylyl-sulfate reductase n=1 Tax=Parasphingopyxis sp. CP4 TaxID=2724527 RepID=UPI0015A43CB1|nr:phosphoadenylyl-sulfate reductase [Parasphingopyxis sp. CP4]QLC22987.1 phosphoadenylyl-sulfate reductase [Parasphingopyxis sp. CP4]